MSTYEPYTHLHPTNQACDSLVKYTPQHVIASCTAKYPQTVTNLRIRGDLYAADAVSRCNQLSPDGQEFSLPWSHLCGYSSMHCPRCLHFQAFTDKETLMNNYTKQLAEHSRMGLFAFTATLANIAADGVKESIQTLGRAARSILKSINAYAGSYWKVELAKSQNPQQSVHPHVHSVVMLPRNNQPTAADIRGKWQQEAGLYALDSDWQRVVVPDNAVHYVTKAEDLLGFSPDEYSTLVTAQKGQRMRGWIN